MLVLALSFSTHGQSPQPGNTSAINAGGMGAISGEIFLTGAVEAEVDLGTTKQRRWIPDETKLAFAWADRPFTVQVPFQMETEVRQLTQYAVPRPDDPRTPAVYAKDYEFRVYFRGFTFTNGGRAQSAQPLVRSAALYRLDGQPVYTEQPAKYYWFQRNWLDNLTARPEDKVSLLWANGRPAVAPGRVSFFLVLDPREMAGQTNYEGRSFQGGIPGDVWAKHYGERTVGKLVVAIHERGKPAAEREFEIPIRQNGWQLREPKLTVSGDWNKAFKSGSTEEWRFQDLGTAVQGLTLTTKHRVTSGSPNNRTNHAATEVEVVLQMPPRVHDHLWTNGNLTVRQMVKGGYPSDARYGLESAVVRFKAFQYGGATNTEPRAVAGWGYLQASTTFEWARSFDSATGLHRESWKVDFYPARISGYAENSRDQNLLNWSWPPEKRIDTHRIYSADINFYADAGEQKPHKHVDFFAVRLSDIEDNRVGRTGVDAVVATKDPLDDGFWEWRVEFNKLCSKVKTRVAAIHGQLQTLLKAKADVDGKFLWLLELDQSAYPKLTEDQGVDWWIKNSKPYVAVQRPRPPAPTLSKQTLAMLREKRNALLETNNQHHADQKALLAEAAQLLGSRVTSAQIQAGKSAEARRAGMFDALDAYKDLGRIEQLRLYESAGLLESEEARALVAELKFPEQSVRDVALLFSAKVAAARAESEDRKLWLQRISPLPPPPNSPVERAARMARAQALLDARESFRLNPSNMEACQMVRKLELDFLSIIAGKLDHGRKISLAAMHQYLDARGFYAKSDSQLTWWEGIKQSGSVFFTSLPSVIALGLGETNVPGSLAESVDIEQTELAKHEVALMAILKLRQNGLPLADIAVADPKTVGQVLTLRRADRKPLEADKAERLCRDIRETFAGLPDLKALVGGSPPEIEALLARSYYDSFDPAVSGKETFANIFFSPQALACMFGPGAIVKGAEGFHFALNGITEAGFQANLLAKGAQAERMSEYLYRGLKVGEMAEKLAGNEMLMTWLVNPMRNAVQADAAFMHGVTTAGRGAGVAAQAGAKAAAAGNFFARFSATMIIVGGASHIADEHHLGALRVLVECIALLGAERVGYELLERSGVPLPKLAAQIEEFAGVVASKESMLVEVTASLNSLERIHQRVSAASGVARGLLEEEVTAARSAGLRSSRGTVLAGSHPEVEMTEAITAAAKALEQGNVKEASRALAAAQAIKAGVEEAITEANSQITQARSAITKARSGTLTESAPAQGPPPTPPAADPPLGEPPPIVPPLASPTPPGPPPAVPSALPTPRSPVALQTARATTPDPLIPAGGYKLDTELGIALKQADDLMRAQEFGQANMFYKKAMAKAESAGDEAMAALFHERTAISEFAAGEAAKLRKQMSSAGAAANAAHPATAPIPMDTELKEILAKIKSGEFILDYQGKSMNPVYFVKAKDTGKTLYVFKHLKAHPGAQPVIMDKVACEVLAECAGPALLNRLKPMAPGSCRVADLGVEVTFLRTKLDAEMNKLLDAAGNEIKESVTEFGTGVLTRFMENEGELWTFKEPALLALKKNYAFQRVFRTWIGDTDGHLRNVVKLGRGQVGAMDFGYGQLGERLVMHQNGHQLFNDPLEFMAQALYYPQMVWAMAFDNPDAVRRGSGKLYGWINRMDDWLSYADLEEAVTSIKGLCERGRKNELMELLTQTGLTEQEAAAAVKTLSERGMAHPRTGESALESVLRRRFDPASPEYDPTRGYDKAMQYKERLLNEEKMRRDLELRRQRRKTGAQLRLPAHERMADASWTASLAAGAPVFDPSRRLTTDLGAWDGSQVPPLQTSSTGVRALAE